MDTDNINNTDTGTDGSSTSSADGSTPPGSSATTTPSSFQDFVPETVREWEEFRNVKGDPVKFFDQIANQRKLIGQSIRIPSKEAGKEDWDKFREKLKKHVPTLMEAPDETDPESYIRVMQRLGAPEDPKGYSLPEIDGVDINELDATLVDIFREVGHKYGITQKQFQGIVKDITTHNLKEAEEYHKKIETNQALIQREWGQATDQNYEFIKTIASKTGAPKALLEQIESKTINLETAKWIMGMAKQLTGESANAVADVAERTQLTPAEARARISEIMNNKQHPYWTGTGQTKQDALDKMVELHKIANPA